MPKGGECPRYIESYPFIPIDVPCRKGQWWAAYVWKTSPRIQEQLYFVRFGCGGFTLGSCCVTYAADCSKQVPSNSQCCWCSKYKAMSIQGRYSSSLNRKEMIRKDRTYWIPELSNSSEQRIGSPKGIIYCTSTKIPRKVMCRIGAFGPICLMGECRALPRKSHPGCTWTFQKMWSRKLANDSNFLKQKGIGWIFLHRNYFAGTGCQEESEWLNRGEYYNLKWDSTAILTSSCATVNPEVWSAAAMMRKIMAKPLASSADNCYRKEKHMVIPVSWSTLHFQLISIDWIFFSTAKNDGYMSYCCCDRLW